MQTTRAIVAVGTAEPTTQSVTVPRNPTIKGPPQQHAAGEIHNRQRPPQTPQAKCQVANRCWAPVPIASGVDDAHFLHHPLMGQIGPTLGDQRIVQRQVRELALAVPPGQFAHLSGTDTALPVVDHDVGIRALLGAGKFVGHSETTRITANNRVF